MFGTRPIPYKMTKESTDWLNFIIYRVLTHFQTPESIAKINALVNDKVKPAKFELLTLGNSPVIPYVATLDVNNKDDIKILIPLTWEEGPSLNFSMLNENLTAEVDLKLFKGTLLVSWPTNQEIDLEIRFINDCKIDFDVSLILFKNTWLPLSSIPLFGPVIKGLISFFMTKGAIKVKAEIQIPDELR
ncbi:hypothetical protein TVAG_194830 [Trichomonas vaginalis G3]|uniref:SMP-LTD domain-containing protein n=1 Tax=Trichomonas vaginalis (strain ATCC PRA-98 / G3) TaxID=412133 RepID=A2FL26_TRIV3|nr:hypothetical protein TVAGG3_1047590 [Trichomonas vaginalis G3]EAX94397.1 hypothetical protein TVAG_194830 [Trichomonas vaginalis G3]KAI5493989.1 hypothetical protein TVAGG3_1047590 [Trichomonas vaginalis G3]|eukprot:XP_001307327.1 hypothetical protein [Trichomonas vaginalis G3]